VSIILGLGSAGAGWSETRQSDSEGMCAFSGVSLEEVLALAYRFPDGCMAAVRARTQESGSKPIQLVFAPELDLRLVLKERDVSVVGVDVGACDPDGIVHLPTATSDTNGLANISRVSGAGWKVKIAHPGYWPSEFIVSPADQNPYPIQVRRLGSLEFILKTPYGNPSIAVPIDVHSVEYQESVETWIATGRVRASSPTLQTDAAGKLRIDGVPNGPYHWRARMPTGEIIEGDASAPPQATALVEVTVP